MYIKRYLESEVLKASKNYPVVMVCGQRQVGKSTMLNHIKEADRRYVTLDDINARRLAETDVGLFFETYGTKQSLFCRRAALLRYSVATLLTPPLSPPPKSQA